MAYETQGDGMTPQHGHEHKAFDSQRQHSTAAAAAAAAAAAPASSASASSYCSPPHTVHVAAHAGLPSPAVVLAPLKHAHERWLKPAELQALLLHARASNYTWTLRVASSAASSADASPGVVRDVMFPLLSTAPPVRPRPGSIYLYNRALVHRWRKDGFAWAGADRHNNLKLHGADVLTCYYAKCAESAGGGAGAGAGSAGPEDINGSISGESFLGTAGSFQRRGYCLTRDSEIILVHYLDDCIKGSGITGSTVSIPAATPSCAPSSGSALTASQSVKLEQGLGECSPAPPPVSIDLTTYLGLFFPTHATSHTGGDMLSAPAAAIYTPPASHSATGPTVPLSQSQQQQPSHQRPLFLRVLSPRRFQTDPPAGVTKHMQQAQQQQQQHIPASLPVVEYAPNSEWLEGGGKLLLLLAPTTPPSPPPLFCHFVRANPSGGAPVSVGSAPLERVGGDASAAYRARIPPVAHAGAFYALYVSDHSIAGAPGAATSALLPFEYRSRDGTVHDVRTLMPMPLNHAHMHAHAAAAASSSATSRLLQPPSPPRSHHHLRRSSSVSPQPFLAAHRGHHIDTRSAAAGADDTATADASGDSSNFERECIVGLLHALQRMEGAVEEATAARSSWSAAAASVRTSCALSLHDVEQCILDAPGDDLIESMLMHALRNTLEVEASCSSHPTHPANGSARAPSSSLLTLASQRDTQGRQMVHYVAGLGYTGLMSILLSQLHADVNSRDGQGLTPLHYAVLADVGDVDDSDGGGGGSAGSPSALMVSALLSFGADDRLVDRAGCTALALADRLGRGHLVQVFLEVQNAESMEDEAANIQAANEGAAHGASTGVSRRHSHNAAFKLASSPSSFAAHSFLFPPRSTTAAATAPVPPPSTAPSSSHRSVAQISISLSDGDQTEHDDSDGDDDTMDNASITDADAHAGAQERFSAGSGVGGMNSSGSGASHAVTSSSLGAPVPVGISPAGGGVDSSAPQLPLALAFSSLTLHDMGISAHALAQFGVGAGGAAGAGGTMGGPSGSGSIDDANALFASDTSHFASVVRRVQRQIRWWLFRRHMAANKLQSVARGMLARRGLKRLRQSTIAIQSAYKARKVRREFVQLKKATKILQDKFRNQRDRGTGGAASPQGARDRSPRAPGDGAGVSRASNSVNHSSRLTPPQLLRPLSMPTVGATGSSTNENEVVSVEQRQPAHLAVPPSSVAVYGHHLHPDDTRPLSALPFRYTPPPPSFDRMSPAAAAAAGDEGVTGSLAHDPLSAMLLAEPHVEAEADAETHADANTLLDQTRVRVRGPSMLSLPSAPSGDSPLPIHVHVHTHPTAAADDMTFMMPYDREPLHTDLQHEHGALSPDMHMLVS